MPLARSVGTTYGVPGLKAALELMGYAGGPPRPPLRPVSSEVVDIIRRQLDALDSQRTRTLPRYVDDSANNHVRSPTYTCRFLQLNVFCSALVRA